MIKEEIEVDNKAWDNHYPKGNLFNKKSYRNKYLKELWQPVHRAEDMLLNFSSNDTEREIFLEAYRNRQFRFDKS